MTGSDDGPGSGNRPDDGSENADGDETTTESCHCRRVPLRAAMSATPLPHLAKSAEPPAETARGGNCEAIQLRPGRQPGPAEPASQAPERRVPEVSHILIFVLKARMWSAITDAGLCDALATGC